MKAKLATLIIAAVDGFAVAYDPAAGLLKGTGICILFGLLCIWFADYLGAFTGPVMRGGYVDSPTPSVLFVTFGWILLCVPLVVYALTWFASLPR